MQMAASAWIFFKINGVQSTMWQLSWPQSRSSGHDHAHCYASNCSHSILHSHRSDAYFHSAHTIAEQISIQCRVCYLIPIQTLLPTMRLQDSTAKTGELPPSCPSTSHSYILIGCPYWLVVLYWYWSCAAIGRGLGHTLQSLSLRFLLNCCLQARVQ